MLLLITHDLDVIMWTWILIKVERMKGKSLNGKGEGRTIKALGPKKVEK